MISSEKIDIPIVSIICDVYNHEPYLRQCLEGFVMQQTSFQFEVLIHDDASTDDSAKIIREYEKKYPRVIKPIYQSKNHYSQSISIWQTYQFPRAQGKYIALCEGDDYWTDPLKLQKQVDFLEAHPDYGLIHTNFQISDTEKCVINVNNCIDDQSLDEYLLGRFHIGTLTVCFRNDLCDKIDFSYQSQHFLMGDYPMWIEIMRLVKIKYLPDVTANYNIHQDSASHSSGLKFKINIVAVQQYFATKYGKTYLLTHIQKEKNFYTSILYFKSHCYLKSIIYLMKSRKLHQLRSWLRYIIVP